MPRTRACLLRCSMCVEEAALIDAVRACWRSAFDPQVTSYAGVQPPRLAVLVQPMVAATAAGIAFTADPVTGERGCVVIDAVAGIGDRLASGAATPDRWIIRGDAIHQDSTAEAAIDESRARLVADLARRVEAEFGTPQDIEWALVDTEVVLLQARPITALPASRSERQWRCRRGTGPGRPAMHHFRGDHSPRPSLTR